MSPKCFRSWFVSVILLTIISGTLWLTPPTPVAALSQLKENTEEPACNSCHDNLYYNHDLGKYYCVANARTRCVACHSGDPTSLDKAIAHMNMEAYPVRGSDLSKCLSCHPRDCDKYVDKFAAVAGFRQAKLVPESIYSTTPELGSASFPAELVGKARSWQEDLTISFALVLVLAGGFLLFKLFRS